MPIDKIDGGYYAAQQGLDPKGDKINVHRNFHGVSMETINVFPTPVCTGQIVPTDQQYHEANVFLDGLWDEAKRGVWAAETGLSTGELEHGQELYENPVFDWLTMPMLTTVKDYWINVVKYRRDYHMYIDSLWANLHDEVDTTGEHSHANGWGKSHVSCVYYFTKGSQGGEILFKNPLEYIHRLCPLDECYDSVDRHGSGQMYDWHEVQPRQFDYVIFPSWLPHKTRPNGPEERIAISMNFSGFPLDPTEGDFGPLDDLEGEHCS